MNRAAATGSLRKMKKLGWFHKSHPFLTFIKLPPRERHATLGLGALRVEQSAWFGLLRRVCRGEEGRYPGLVGVTVVRRRPHHGEHVLMPGVPVPVLGSTFHSLSRWFPNADPRIHLMP